MSAKWAKTGPFRGLLRVFQLHWLFVIWPFAVIDAYEFPEKTRYQGVRQPEDYFGE
jgi:hypothetical protein